MDKKESQEIFNNHSTKEMTIHPTMNTKSTSSSSPAKIEKKRGRPPKITSPLSYPVKWQFMKEEGEAHVSSSKKQSRRNRGDNDISIVNCYDMFKEGASPRTDSSCTSSTYSSPIITTNSNFSQRTNFQQLTEFSPNMSQQPTITKSNSEPIFNYTQSSSSTTTSNNPPPPSTINNNSNFNSSVGSSGGAAAVVQHVISKTPQSPCHSMDSYFVPPPIHSSSSFPPQPTYSNPNMLSNNNNINHTSYYPPNCNIPSPQPSQHSQHSQYHHQQQQVNNFPTPIQTNHFSTPKKQVSHSPKSTSSPLSSSNGSSLYHSWKVDLSPPNGPYQKHGELSFSLNDTIQVNSNNYKVSMTSKKASPSSSVGSCKISPPKFTNQFTTSIVATNTAAREKLVSSPQTVLPPSMNVSSSICSSSTPFCSSSNNTTIVSIGDDHPTEVVSNHSNTNTASSTTSPNKTSKGRTAMPSLKDILN